MNKRWGGEGGHTMCPSLPLESGREDSTASCAHCAAGRCKVRVDSLLL